MYINIFEVSSMPPVITESTALEQPAPEARRALVDIGLVLAASALAFAAEDLANAREWLSVGPEYRGLSAVLAGAVTAVAVVLVRGGSLADLGFKRPKRWALVPVQVVTILVAFVAMQTLTPLLVSTFVTVPEPDLSRYDALAGNLGAALALALLLPFSAAIPEEIIYRGFLLGRLSSLFRQGRSGAVLAVCVQGLMFGAVHYQWGPGGMLVMVVMGIVWGSAYLLCDRNLWVVIAAHSAGHLLGVLQLYLGGSIII